MKTEEIILNNFILKYSIDKFAPLENILFIDIETTGLSPADSNLYMIGTAYYSEENWNIKQFFAESPEEEATVLKAFFDFAKDFTYLIHFNGNTFDLPYIRSKAEKHNLSNTLVDMEGLDIYRRIMPYKNLLKLENCRLKTIERFLGIEREDEYSGGELISVYKDFCSSRDFKLYRTLLLHNSDDMKGMLEILPILSYYDLFNNTLTATKVMSNCYSDISGIVRRELLINLFIKEALPQSITFMGQGCHFKAFKNSGTLVVPIFEEELKYFYANYKDYYYLPLEDEALHKSIASYVDKEYRENAKASNCYTRKYGSYLPQWDVLFEPFFKRDYESTDLFFELTDDIKQNRELFSAYANHVLNKLAFQK